MRGCLALVTPYARKYAHWLLRARIDGLYSVTITDRKGRTIVARPLSDSTITIDKERKKKIEDKVKAARDEGSKLSTFKSVKAFVAQAVDVALPKEERELVRDILDTTMGNAITILEMQCNRTEEAKHVNKDLKSRLIACAGTGRGTLFVVLDSLPSNEILSIAAFPDWDEALHYLSSELNQMIEEGLAVDEWKHEVCHSIYHSELRCVLPLKVGAALRGRIVFGCVKVPENELSVWLDGQLTLMKGW